MTIALALLTAAALTSASALAAPPAPASDEAPDGTAPLPCGSVPEGMACVPGGWFVRGTDDGPEDTRPAARVWVQTFYMDLNEATTAEYKACVKARDCDRAGPNYNDFSRPRQPIVGISWFDAKKYCGAHDKRLPSEAEWEKAARGPDGEANPFGDVPITCENAVIADERGRSCGVNKQGSAGYKGRTFEIGSRPAGRYGLFDMAGNSWEWVLDWHSKSYAACGEACQGKDPRGPCGGAERCPGHRRRVVRGGSWYWPATHSAGFWRRAHVPSNRPFHHFGFRCAASVRAASK